MKTIRAQDSHARRESHLKRPVSFSLALPVVVGIALGIIPSIRSAQGSSEADMFAFTDKYCSSCHNDVDKEGGLDLTSLKYSPGDAANFVAWVKVHDRVQAGEMPPKEKKRPPQAELGTFVKVLGSSLTAADKSAAAREGRTTQRRLNRYEFENAIRDLLQAPWLQVKNDLPEDGEAELFNKIGDALDVSHVQMTRYMKAANLAFRHTMGVELMRQELPPPAVKRYYAREERVLPRQFRSGPPGRFQSQSPERSTFPVLGIGGDPDVRAQLAPHSAGAENPAKRELEGVGWVRSNYHPFHTIWDNFRAPVAGMYKVRWMGYSIWAGPNGFSTAQVAQKTDNGRGRGGAGGAAQRPRDMNTKWNSPDADFITTGRRNEPITIYAQGPIDVRRVAEFTITPEPKVYDIGTVMILENESLVTDAARFFRDRPGSSGNPLAQRDGQPAVAFRWMEVEGPLFDDSTTAGYRTMFGDLPLQKKEKGEVLIRKLLPVVNSAWWMPSPTRGGPMADYRGSSAENRGPDGAGGYGRVMLTEDVPVAVIPNQPEQDTERLLREFMKRAYRRPVKEQEVQRYLAVIRNELKNGHDFAYAMIAGYTAVVCSPGFLYLEEKPGKLDGYSLASRLSFFLWNSAPDQVLLDHARNGDLNKPEVLRTQTERMLKDRKAERFVNAFLDYWLELRKYDATTPANVLYPDYYLDEQLSEAALDESRMFFTELLQKDLPARNVIDSDFTFLNERLAVHYGIPGVEGGSMRRVSLPKDSVRGGVMTQAMVLKVTANGTSTSPVIRGKWITERILGQIVPPPPSAVPAVDPDTRGAVTIRQQLDKHRADESCGVCHRKIDPQGFALENFDVMGGWRTQYRGDAKDKIPAQGQGKNGWAFDFHYSLPVESSGQLADGRKFNDVRDFKQLLLKDEPQIARNLARHLAVYATGSPVRFSDREQIEKILQQTKSGQYGVRSLVHAIIQNDLFLNK